MYEIFLSMYISFILWQGDLLSLIIGAEGWNHRKLLLSSLPPPKEPIPPTISAQHWNVAMELYNHKHFCERHQREMAIDGGRLVWWYVCGNLPFLAISMFGKYVISATHCSSSYEFILAIYWLVTVEIVKMNGIRPCQIQRD